MNMSLKCSTKEKLKFVDCFDLPNPGLRAFLDSVEKGQAEIYHTPWIKVPEDWDLQRKNKEILRQFDAIMSEWIPHLDKLATSWPSLYEFEKDLAAKNGPMSIMKPLSERINDIDAYYDGILLPAEQLTDDAIAATIDKFKQCKGLMIRSQQKTVDLMKKSTNSGSPYYTRKKNVVAKTVPCSVQGCYQYLDGDTEWGSCAILGWRGQEGGPTEDSTKQRVVWMFPFAVNIRELQMYQPLIECCQSFDLVPAWVSMESVDRHVTRLFDTKGKDDLVICTDFSKFDQHFNPCMQDAARRVLQGLCRNTEDNNRWLEEVFPIKYEIPLAYRFGELRMGKHGMGSGSG